MAAIIRQATLGDIPFLVETIVAAEKSNSPRMGLSILFDLSEAGTRKLIGAMLEEEVDGCELSISSFLIAEVDGRPAAAVAGWVEGDGEEMPSALLKANLIGFTFPPESMALLRERAPIVSGVQIEREKDALQIEYVHTDPAFRGRGLAGELIRAHLAKAGPRKAQVQAFADNRVAIALYERLGFHITHTRTSTHPDTIRYLPYHAKVLMERPTHA
ncbi:MAG: GNAT family N-acetyltransferase [Flavobacteriales bacterium]